MESRQVRVEAVVIGTAKVNVVINVPKSSNDELAEAYGHEYLKKQYPVPYAKNTILDIKITLIAEPKKQDAVADKLAKEAGADAVQVKASEPEFKNKHSKRGNRDMEGASRKQVKERLQQAVA